MQNIHSKIGHPIIWSVAVVAVFASLLYVFILRDNTEYITSPVVLDDIVQSVSASGSVTPAEEVDLAFEVSGRVSTVSVDVGDRVSAGQVLVQLDSGDESAGRAKALAQLQSAEAQLLRYKAVVDEAKATLNDLLAGTREEELDIQKTKLASAQQDLQNSYDDVYLLLQEHYNKADDAVRKQTDALFLNDNFISPVLSFSTSNSQLKSNAESQRYLAGKSLDDWQLLLNSLSIFSSDTEFDQAMVDSLIDLGVIRDFLNTVSQALDSSLGLSETTVATYKASVNTGRSAVSTAINDIVAQQQTLASNKQSIVTEEQQLTLLQAGVTQQTIDAQQARVRQAEANFAAQEAQVSLARADLLAANTNLVKTTLNAPFDGIVTVQKARVGGAVSANSVVVMIISESDFEIELNVSEVDIAKFKLGDPAEVSFDAFDPDFKVMARVGSVDPDDQLISGVPSYRVVLFLDDSDLELLSGMTANAVVSSLQKTSVLLIPQRAVYERDGQRYVRILLSKNSSETVEKKITTGSIDGFGRVEVISGLEVGELVIVSEKSGQ